MMKKEMLQVGENNLEFVHSNGMPGTSGETDEVKAEKFKF